MPDPSATTERTERRIAVAVLAVACLAGGALVGAHATWGEKSAQVATGVAMRANDENSLVMFDADDGMQLSIAADAIAWESGSTGGDGDPPCLDVPLRKARVDVGYLTVAMPDGGSRVTPVWVRCLDGSPPPG